MGTIEYRYPFIQCIGGAVIKGEIQLHKLPSHL